ncbi:MAG: hypothetical protein JNG89_15990 [Planctomycetaceae bacterium]|nr:hypothetical protein [Planctomycetaceae bacterium]
MTAQEPDDSGHIDRLVREHLDRQAAAMDTAGLLESIRSGIPAAEVGAPVRASRAGGHSTPRPLRRKWLWPAGMALGLIVAFLGGRYLTPAAASPTLLLREVQAVHSRAVDHFYQVQFAPDPRFTNPDNPMDRPTDNTLWTRGDRFWCDCALGDHRLAVGRDESGRLWCAPSRSKGILLPSRESEISPEFRLICAINSMSIPRLVDDVLDGFELHAEVSSRGTAAETSVIWARLKPGQTHRLISSAVMEVDANSDIVQRLVLWIVKDGHPHGTVTYTLVESTVHDDQQYRLSAHIDADAEIVDQSPAPETSEPPTNQAQ